MRATRFLTIWTSVFVALLILGAIEGAVLWRCGFQYRPPSSIFGASVTDLSIDAQGDRAVAIVRVKPQSDAPPWNDLIFLNLGQRVPVWLGLQDYAPTCVAMEPRSREIAFSNSNGTIFLLPISSEGEPETESVTELVHTDPHIHQLLYSPDGAYLAACGPRSIFVWRRRDGHLLHCYEHSESRFKSFAFSANSRRAFSPRGSSGLCVWDVLSGDVTKTIWVDRTQGSQVAWSFESHKVGVVTRDEVGCFDPDTGQHLWKAPGSHVLLDSAFSCGGQLLAYEGIREGRSGVDVRASASGNRVGWIDTPNRIKALKFSPNGELYIWDNQGNVDAWDAERSTRLWTISLLDESPY